MRIESGYDIPEYDSKEYKEKIAKELKEYKGIITKSLYDSLNSILELEISAFSNEINDKTREMLTKIDFDLYRKILIYNILCRIQKLFAEDSDKLQIKSNNWFNKLEIFIQGKRINEENYDENPNLHLFNFTFKPKEDSVVFQRPSKTQLLETVRTQSIIIGDINIHEYIKRIGQNLKNVDAYQRKLEEEKKKNYGTFVGEVTNYSDLGLNNGHFATCNSDLMEIQNYRAEQIEKYQNIIQYYQNKKGLTDEEKLAIEMSQKYHPLLLKELGATSEELELVKTYTDAKVLKLTKPNYNIKNTTHYVE